jgi:uncharacterized 2Fe-2S/4Fe-4S cluster protein (DUF4445 family)
MVTVTFAPSGASVSVETGSTLLEAAGAAGLTFHAPCGGVGRCGKCLVEVHAGVSEPSEAERKVFAPAELAAGQRLACQARVVADCEVSVPAGSLILKHRIAVEGIGREIDIEPCVEKVALRLPPPSAEDPRADLDRVLEALDRDVVSAPSLPLLRGLPETLRAQSYQVTAVLQDRVLTALEAGDTSQAAYGAAVDIGTTTVVLYLCLLPTGEVVGIASDLNPQAQFGDDLVSRINLAISEPDGLEQLHRAICNLVDDLLTRATTAAEVRRDQVYELAVVGNTCMTHLFLGVSPKGLSALPFASVFRGGQYVAAADLGLRINPVGRVYVVPNIGGFVGADTVGVIVASELDLADGPRAAVDIGTNGEIVVSHAGALYACSTAAGPAFEGARIRQGMRAAAGAIDAVSIDGDVHYHVIGDTAPRGLCGSGLVDAVAGMVQAGVVGETGRLLPPEELPPQAEKVKRRVVENDLGLEFILASAEETGLGRPVSVTARDVRELQLAKGAIFAGITLLLDRAGLKPMDLDRLLLAGAFGNYIRRESAIAIGLVPDLPEGRLQSIGNAAGLGARLVLGSASLRRRAEEVSRRVQHIELSEQEEFYDRFAEAMALRPLPRGES